jgi:hypothetical protein
MPFGKNKGFRLDAILLLGKLMKFLLTLGLAVGLSASALAGEVYWTVLNFYTLDAERYTVLRAASGKSLELRGPDGHTTEPRLSELQRVFFLLSSRTTSSSRTSG